MLTCLINELFKDRLKMLHGTSTIRPNTLKAIIGKLFLNSRESSHFFFFLSLYANFPYFFFLLSWTRTLIRVWPWTNRKINWVHSDTGRPLRHTSVIAPSPLPRTTPSPPRCASPGSVTASFIPRCAFVRRATETFLTPSSVLGVQYTPSSLLRATPPSLLRLTFIFIRATSHKVEEFILVT